MKPVIILDDVFSEGDLIELDSVGKNINKQGEWHKWDKYGNTIYTYYWLLVHKASSYYDIQKVKGIEVWTHDNSRPTADMNGGWHYDKDEYRWSSNKILSFPVCSLVFYLEAENLSGGNLLFRDISIKPKRNRLVIFGPGIQHRVEEYEGKRFSVNINVWNRKLEEYDW